MIILLIVGPLIIFLVRMILNLFLTKEANLPPGPYPWPIIGNLFQIGKNAHVQLAKMAQVHGPLMSLRLGQQTLIVGSSPIVASEILKTHDHVLSARYVPILLQDKEPTVYNMNLVFKSECDDGWRSLRNIYKSEVFSSKAMESRVTMRENKVMEMVKYIRSKEGEDIVIKDVMFVTAINILSNTSLSIDIVDFEGNGIGAGIKDSVRKVAMLCAKPQLADLYPILGRLDLHDWYKKVMYIMECEFKTIWEDILQSKRNGSRDLLNLKDFMDILIDRGFTDQQIYPVMEVKFHPSLSLFFSSLTH